MGGIHVRYIQPRPHTRILNLGNYKVLYVVVYVHMHTHLYLQNLSNLQQQ